MKRYFLKPVVLLLSLLLITSVSYEQIVVRIRPAAPYYRPRPVRPGPVHVWVDGDYALRRGEYIYQEGYWTIPPPGMHIWKRGRWKHYKGGWVWIPGFWR